jgi:ribosomal protein S18 acetylase RimI-like enzyme
VQNSFNIRQATVADVPALAALHVTTFIETHGGFNPPPFEIRKIQWQQIFASKDKTWFCFVIEDKNEGLIGFAKGQPYDHPDLPEYAGELNKIYILHKYHNLGLGRELICKVAHTFVGRGINSMLLFGEADNPSNKFYEHMGAEKLFAQNGEFNGGYGWKDLQKLVAGCKHS